MADGSFGGGKPKNGLPDWVGPYKGVHDVIPTWSDDTFCVTVLTTSFQTFELALPAPECKLSILKGWGARLPSPAGLGNQGEYRKVSQRHGELMIHCDICLMKFIK